MQVFIFGERRVSGAGPLSAYVVLAKSEKDAWSELIKGIQSRWADVSEEEVRDGWRLLKQQKKSGVVLRYSRNSMEIQDMDDRTICSIVDN